MAGIAGTACLRARETILTEKAGSRESPKRKSFGIDFFNRK
jgi:hypothetical protein